MVLVSSCVLPAVGNTVPNCQLRVVINICCTGEPQNEGVLTTCLQQWNLQQQGYAKYEGRLGVDHSHEELHILQKP